MLPTPPSLAVSLAGLSRDAGLPWAGGPRGALDWAAGLGLGAVQLDAAMPGARARELDRSARRDLAAGLRRRGLALAGLDLWIPAEHFADPAHQDRAIAATVEALGLASDLASLNASHGAAAAPVVCVTLPAEVPDEVLSAVSPHGTITDCAWPACERAATGFDPAAVIAAGEDPVMTVAGPGGPPACARLSDLSAAGRCVPGVEGGRLALDAYSAMLVTLGYERPVVLDLRGLRSPAEAARLAIHAWRSAGAPPE